MKYYVYAHYLEGENFPFYIGKGKGSRYKDLSPRNQSWADYVEGCNIITKILEWFENEASALEKEVELIAEYGRMDLGTGCLTNRSDGGEIGFSGSVIDREHLSNVTKKKWQDEEYRKKMADIHGSKEWREANSAKLKKMWRTPEIKEKLLTSYRKRSDNPEYRKKLSDSLMGHSSVTKGTRWATTPEGVGKRIGPEDILPEGWHWGKPDWRKANRD